MPDETRRGEQRVHPVDEVLPAGRMAAFGLQHVMTMYAGIIAVPLIVATALKLPPDQLVYIINASFFMCGIATLIQAIGFPGVGAKLPIVQGTSFAAVTPMIVIGGEYGLPGVYGSVIVAGLLTVGIAPFFGRLLRFFPPVVTGSIITIIGVSLMPVAVRWSAGGVPDAPDFGAPGNILLALGTLVVILLITRFAGNFFGGFLSRIAILLGLIIGTVFAAFAGVADFARVGEAGLVGLTLPFEFGLPTFHLIPIISLSLIMLIIMVETTADVLAIGEITEKPVGQKEVTRGLRADGLSTALGGVFNTFPFSAFAQNVGLVRFTGIKSRFVVAAAGAVLIVLGLFPKLAAVVASIPLPVLGGAGLVLFGSVAAAGIQTLSKVDLADNRNLTIVAVAIALGVIPAVLPEFYEGFPEAVRTVFESGITSASVAAILLNILFNILGGSGQEMSFPVSDLPERISVLEANEMGREEFVRRFGSLYQNGDWLADRVYDRRPFDNFSELRYAFQDVVFDAPPERQLELMRSYPNLGESAEVDGSLEDSGLSREDLQGLAAPALGPASARDQAFAGLDRLTPEEYETFQQINSDYREKFGFPLVVAVRGHSKETIMEDGANRLENPPAQERVTALVEIAKIAGFRLRDIVQEPEDRQRPVATQAAGH